MAHIRQQIRDRVIADVTGLATTGANVYDSKLYTFTQGELPALAVYTQNETSEISTIAPAVDFTSEGEKPLGICKLTYNVRYMNNVTNSTIPL